MARLVNRHRRNPTYRVTVSLGMIQPDVVLFFKQTFGGTFVMRKKYGNQRQSYQWQLNDMGAYKFLIQMRPYVRLKAKQFDVAIELHERVQKTHQMYRRGFPRGATTPAYEMAIRHDLCERIRQIKFAEEPLGTLTIGANSAETCDGNAELNEANHL